MELHPDFQSLINIIPLRKKKTIKKFDAWCKFLNDCIYTFLQSDAVVLLKREKKTHIEFPQIDFIPTGQSKIQVLHQFTTRESEKIIDPIINRIKNLMRNAHNDVFEGEEVVALWCNPKGINIPTPLPSGCSYPQGGYIMYMEGSAKQRPHVHGILSNRKKFISSTGNRYLIGLIGANNSTIRTLDKVHIFNRGDLVLINFPHMQAPTIHQFWNSDENGDRGNVFLSFHDIDFWDGDLSILSNKSEMMNRRTFLINDKLLNQATKNFAFIR